VVLAAITLVSPTPHAQAQDPPRTQQPPQVQEPPQAQEPPGAPDPIDLSRVEELARERSSSFQELEARYERDVFAAEGRFRPYNPVLGWDGEYLDEFGEGIWEHIVFVQQRVRLPGVGSRMRRVSEGQREGAALARHRDEAVWLADARHAFVRTALAEAELALLARLDAVVDELREAARLRAREGEISGWELRLLEMGEYQLGSLVAERELEQAAREQRWTSLMSLQEPGELRFDPHAALEGFLVPEEEELLAWVSEAPATRAARHQVELARREISLEEGRRWSELDLRAGYRQVSPEHRGFVLGTAIPLPLRDRNQPAIREARAEERASELRADFQAAADRARVRELHQTLLALDRRLEDFPSGLHDPETFVSTLIAVYEEGTESLSGTVSALTLLADTYRTWFDELDGYFEAVFELEALTGRRLLSP